MKCIQYSKAIGIYICTSTKRTGQSLLQTSGPCRMIEEFMLLANMAVARVISEAYPTSAMLRRHPKPKERAAAILVSTVSE